jgi:UDP-glucose 4-epimerase
VHISDVTAAMLTVIRRADYLRRSGVPVVLNIGSGVPTTLAQIHQGLEQVVHRTIDVERSAARSFDRRDVWLDVGLARETLGWKPTIALAPGLLDTWRHEIGQIPLHAIRAKS